MEDYKELISLCDYWISLSDENDKEAMDDQLLKRCICAIEHLVEERDAMLADLKEYAKCECCKYVNGYVDDEPCNSCVGGYSRNFEWRGVQE